jgi:hypothetical protein
MEETLQPQATTCSKCDSIIEIENIFCSNCGYPEHGTEKDIAVFHANKAMERNKNMDAGKKIKSARNTLYVMAGVTFVFGVFLFFQDYDSAVLITNVILSLIYLVLGYWSMKKPVMALLLGLLLYLTTIIISAVFEPTTLVRGILWKVIIIAFLGKGLYSALSIKK